MRADNTRHILDAAHRRSEYTRAKAIQALRTLDAVPCPEPSAEGRRLECMCVVPVREHLPGHGTPGAPLGFTQRRCR